MALSPDDPDKQDQPLAENDLQAIAELTTARNRVRDELGKVIVGQAEVIDQLLIAIFSQGHCLLEGVPGLAKTLMVSTLARSFDMSFARVQFTPDLMPSDITGTEVIQDDRATGQRQFKFLHGPIFANVILADEINRTPPKTQAALLEAMQEKQITVGGRKWELPRPFFVLATQNPIEQEGTYPLPEAQQDRFMFKVFVNYPSYDEEYRIAEQTTAIWDPTVEPVLNADQVLHLQSLVRRVPAAPHVINYALRLVRATRVQEPGVPDFVNEWVSWGAGPRAVQYLLLGGKARAALEGRTYVTTDDVKAVAYPGLRHRVITNFSAQSQDVTTDQVTEKLLAAISDQDTGEAVSADVQRALSD